MEDKKKIYRVTLSAAICNPYNDTCYRRLTDDEYTLIDGIIKESDKGGSMEELEFLWPVVIIRGRTPESSAIIKYGHRLIPIDRNSKFMPSFALNISDMDSKRIVKDNINGQQFKLFQECLFYNSEINADAAIAGFKAGLNCQFVDLSYDDEQIITQ